MHTGKLAVLVAASWLGAVPLSAQDYAPINVRTDAGTASCNFTAAPHIFLTGDFIAFNMKADTPDEGSLRVARPYRADGSGAATDATLSVRSPAFTKSGVKSARLQLDRGTPIATAHEHWEHEEDGWADSLEIGIADHEAKLAGASLLTVTNFDDDGRELHRARFDVSESRHFEPIAARRARGCTR